MKYFIAFISFFIASHSFAQCDTVGTVGAFSTTYNSTQISFTTPNAHINYVIVYIDGTDTSRQNVNDPGSPYPHLVTSPLTGLTPSTMYTYYIVANCAGPDSALTSNFTFTTTAPSCDTVTNINVSVTNNSATISADEAAYGDTYTIFYIRSGQVDTVTVSGGTADHVLSGLKNNTVYYYRIRTNCTTYSDTTSTGIHSFTTASSPNYTPMDNKGYQYKRTASDSTASIPTFNGFPNLRGGKNDKAAIAYDSTNSKGYFFNPKTQAFNEISAAADTTAIVDSIVEMQLFSEGKKQIFNRDSLRGGRFNLVFDSTITDDDGINFAATGIGSGYHWKRETTQSLGVLVTWFGVDNTGITDNSIEIQAAIDYCAGRGGGTVYFPDGKYKGNVIIKPGVALVGSVSHTSANTTYYRVQWTAATSGILINTPDYPLSGTTCDGATIRGFQFQGLGVDSALIGVKIQSARKFFIDQCAFNNFADQAIYQIDPPTGTNGSLSITNCFAQNCLLNRVRTDYTGVFDLSGTDGFINWCEVTGSLSAKSDSGRIVAIALHGADWEIANTLAEFGDVNFYFQGVNAIRLMATNFKTDKSFKESVIFDGAKDSYMQGLVKRAGQSANNTYDAVSVINSSLRNIFAISVTNLPGTDSLPRYAFSETLSTTTLTNKNDFTLCRASSSSYATALYYNSSSNGSQMPVNITAAIDSTTRPNVNGKGFIVLQGGATVTNFTNGTPGQELKVLVNDAATISYSADSIKLAGSTSLSATSKTLLSFKNYNGVWYETSNSFNTRYLWNFTSLNSSLNLQTGRLHYSYEVANTAARVYTIVYSSSYPTGVKFNFRKTTNNAFTGTIIGDGSTTITGFPSGVVLQDSGDFVNMIYEGSGVWGVEALYLKSAVAAAAPVQSVTATNTTMTISPTTGSVLVGLNLANANTWTGLQTFNKPNAFTGTTPGIAAGTGAGTSPTVSITGNDATGYISVLTGSSPTLSGDIVTISFSATLAGTPKAIDLTPANGQAATHIVRYFADQASASTTSWKIVNNGTALAAGATYLFFYRVSQ